VKRLIPVFIIVAILLAALAPRINEESHGEPKLVFIDGKVYRPLSITPYTGSWVGHYPSGKVVQKGSFVNGLQDGDWVWLHENGTLLKDNGWGNGSRINGPHFFWHDNGRLRPVGFWQDDHWEGLWLEWDKQGNLAKINCKKNGYISRVETCYDNS
jgi:antitoxin component YwqK of YwqJK toxin-antitoxin module